MCVCEGERGREKNTVFVSHLTTSNIECVCVYEREKERERERESVRVRKRESVNIKVM